MHQLLNLAFFDFLLLVFCPLLAVLGGLVHVYATNRDYNKPMPDNYFEKRRQEIRDRIHWMAGHAFISAMAGGMNALFFIGHLNNDIYLFIRICGLSVIVGYSAPKFWNKDDEIEGRL